MIMSIVMRPKARVMAEQTFWEVLKTQSPPMTPALGRVSRNFLMRKARDKELKLKHTKTL